LVWTCASKLAPTKPIVFADNAAGLAQKIFIETLWLKPVVSLEFSGVVRTDGA
jgi:hypothetical protein